MICPSCNTETFGVQDEVNLWCDNCGHCLRDSPVYVTGYCQSHSCKNQIYSRRKRFGKYLQTVCHQSSVLQSFYDILDLYSRFEFTWTQSETKRIYFFAKPVMLRFCCEMLGLDTDNLPSLKDKNRIKEQARELSTLRLCALWKLMYGHLETTQTCNKNDTETEAYLPNRRVPSESAPN